MSKTKKMVCPDCGVEMNYHADRVDYSAGENEESAIDPVLGGVIEEAHSCPGCGRTHTRPKVYEEGNEQG
ncbi:MAG TPA: hypothetical protein VE842_12980 [Pyrinomonadaceae bacterium]|nr:hypothetical protein [Pyrinomonadaceae bacterium]